MRHILTIILFSFFSFTVLAANFNTTGWKTYLSYNNTNSVEESNDQVFLFIRMEKMIIVLSNIIKETD